MPTCVLQRFIDAASGILTIKQIKVLEDQYMPSLESMYITFLTAPVISDSFQMTASIEGLVTKNPSINIPITLEAEPTWLWVEVSNNQTWVTANIPLSIPKTIFKTRQQISEG